MSFKTSTKNTLCRLINCGFIAILTLTFSPVSAQNSTPTEVRGQVTDKSGTGIPGVSVKEKSTQNAVITNDEGKYSIKLQNPNSTLVFSYIGFNSLEKNVTGGMMNVGLL
ncbi:MAG: carboxypeptidase-like regulatory domain-containing protein, partial [Pedobacter sp.]|nr:carboxypeptidase-like regulatory domain-containing protein [Pedobacter sp.]